MNYSTDWDTLLKNYTTFLRFEKNFSEHTVASYLHDVCRMREYICGEGEKPATEISRADIEQLMASLYDLGMEPATQARMLSGIKSFFNFLLLSDIIGDSPAALIDPPRPGQHLPDVLTVEEIDAIMGAIDPSHPQGVRNLAMLETLYSCGLRVSELTGLKISDLFFDEGFIRVTGKGDKQRLVPVSSVAVERINHYLGQRLRMRPDGRNSDILFLNRNGRQLTRVMVFTIVKQAALLAGIDRSVSPHTFRHSFATHLLEGGAGIRQVQQLLGHESIITTEIYTHLDRSHLRRSVEQHHPLSRKREGK